MRLTLRTLLAYLDGILDPNDTQDLGKKIEESEYATGLVHRLRDVLRRLRLGAPSLTDRGPGLDPNTVAEYLDNTLPTERVTDFEKVCLDSDIHLAEVGSCHQILTLVLGEPAEVAPASRQRMYELENVHTGAKPPPPPTASTTPAMPRTIPSLSLDLEVGGDESAERRPRPKPTVPEYLREPRRRPTWLTAAAAVLVAACVIVVMAKAFGLLEPGTPGGKLLSRLGLVAASWELTREDGRGEGREESGKGDEDKGAAPSGESAVDNAKKPSEESGTQPTRKSPAESVKPTVPGTEPPGAPKNGTRATVTPENPLKPDKGVNPEQKTPPTAVEPKTVKKPVVSATEPGAKTQKKSTPEAALPPELLGQLVSSEQVLLSSDPTNGWTRVAANQMLIPQDVLALPTYRPKVKLTVGVALEMVGGTRVELLGSTPQEMPGIRIKYGRVVLMPSEKAGLRLRMTFGDHSGTITFVDAESIAALEVRNLHAPGVNPEDVPPRVTAELFVASGTILWEETAKDAAKEKAGKSIRLAPPQRLGFDAELTGEPVAANGMPDWITAGESIKPTDRLASPVLAAALPTDRPARIRLLELTTSQPRREVKSLALRCLGYVGQFRDMVAALNDPAHKTEWWDYYVPELRAAVARDSETAAAVRLALEKQYPQQAPDLYRMLLGYTNKQLQFGDDGKQPEGKGEDYKLVQGLKSESLAVNVLSFWNLRDITGKGIYQPELPAAHRQPSVHRWEQRLEAKEIRLTRPFEPKARPAREPVAPPDARPPREPLAPPDAANSAR